MSDTDLEGYGSPNREKRLDPHPHQTNEDPYHGLTLSKNSYSHHTCFNGLTAAYRINLLCIENQCFGAGGTEIILRPGAGAEINN